MSKRRSQGSGRKHHYDPYERENERIMSLFQEASSEEDNGDLSSGSERPEKSSNDGSQSEEDNEYDAVLESEIEGDPYSDPDGEYGSDANYNPDDDTDRSTTTSEEDDAQQEQDHAQQDDAKQDSPDQEEAVQSKRKYSVDHDHSYGLSNTSKEDYSILQQLDTTETLGPVLLSPENQNQENISPDNFAGEPQETVSIHVDQSADDHSNLGQKYVSTNFHQPTDDRSNEPPDNTSANVGLPADDRSNEPQENIPIDVGLPADDRSNEPQENIPVDVGLPADDRSNEPQENIPVDVGLPADDSSNEPQENIHVDVGVSADDRSNEPQENISVDVDMPANDSSNEPQANIPAGEEQPSTSNSDPIRSTRRNNSPILVTTQEWEDTVDSIPEFSFNSGNVGPTMTVNQSTLPMDIINYFLDSNLIEYVVTCINKYGEALCNTNRPHTRGSRKHTFKLLTPDELKKFLGLCILQSHIETPNIRKLFTFTEPLYYHPIFTYTMSCRRFEQILRCFCVYIGNEKGMGKIKDFIAMIISKFQEAYKPDRELSIDESMMLFRGRLSFRQYIKSKKAKYGVKFYVLTTYDGYILNFKIYEGKSTLDEDVSGSKIEKLVMLLMRSYLDKGHHLYMDNFYNSVILSKKLLERRTHTTGTLRKDRKHNPKELLNKKLKKGEHFWKRNGKVYVSIWKDKRPVPMITTKHHPRIMTTHNRYDKQLEKPIEIVDYNKYMSGIDRADQMLAYYSTPKKSVRWHKKVIFRILDMTIWNAFYIYRKYSNQNAHLLHFREDIIKVYLGISNIDLKCYDMVTECNRNNNRLRMSFGISETNNQPRPAPVMDLSASGLAPTKNTHWPEPIPKPPNSNRNKVFLRCRQCTKNKLRKHTSYRCMGCTEKVPLCPGCFDAYHANDDDIIED